MHHVCQDEEGREETDQAKKSDEEIKVAITEENVWTFTRAQLLRYVEQKKEKKLTGNKGQMIEQLLGKSVPNPKKASKQASSVITEDNVWSYNVADLRAYAAEKEIRNSFYREIEGEYHKSVDGERD